MMDWVGSGKYFMHVLAKFENTENARKQGLPVRQIFSEKEGGHDQHRLRTYRQFQERSPSQRNQGLPQLVSVAQWPNHLAKTHWEKFLSR